MRVKVYLWKLSLINYHKVVEYDDLKFDPKLWQWLWTDVACHPLRTGNSPGHHFLGSAVVSHRQNGTQQTWNCIAFQIFFSIMSCENKNLYRTKEGEIHGYRVFVCSHLGMNLYLLTPCLAIVLNLIIAELKLISQDRNFHLCSNIPPLLCKTTALRSSNPLLLCFPP